MLSKFSIHIRGNPFLPVIPLNGSTNHKTLRLCNTLYTPKSHPLWTFWTWQFIYFICVSRSKWNLDIFTKSLWNVHKWRESCVGCQLDKPQMERHGRPNCCTDFVLGEEGEVHHQSIKLERVVHVQDNIRVILKVTLSLGPSLTL